MDNALFGLRERGRRGGERVIHDVRPYPRWRLRADRMPVAARIGHGPTLRELAERVG
jgi:hypothetical protein